MPVLLIVAVGCFLLLSAAPGDAVDAYLAETGGAVRGADLRAAWGLDDNPAARLAAYLWRLARLDLGWSTALQRPVLTAVLERLPTTLLLMGTATALAACVGTALGIVAGSRPHGLRDRVITTLAAGLYALPTFWLALMLLILFAVRLAWLPTGGLETIGAPLAGFARVTDIARHLTLPVASLALVYAGLYQRLMRAGMIEAWDLPHVRTARAMGLGRRRVVLHHVARLALLPVVTMLGLQAGALLGGSVVVESVFAIPGMGRLAAEAVAQRDTPLLLGVILIGTVTVIGVNLMVDLVTLRLDPRTARR